MTVLDGTSHSATQAKSSHSSVLTATIATSPGPSSARATGTPIRQAAAVARQALSVIYVSIVTTNNNIRRQARCQAPVIQPDPRVRPAAPEVASIILHTHTARGDARPPVGDIQTVGRILLEGERVPSRSLQAKAGPREPRGQRVNTEDHARPNVLMRGFGFAEPTPLISHAFPIYGQCLLTKQLCHNTGSGLTTPRRPHFVVHTSSPLSSSPTLRRSHHAAPYWKLPVYSRKSHSSNGLAELGLQADQYRHHGHGERRDENSDAASFRPVSAGSS
jgi:hypothetical protein